MLNLDQGNFCLIFIGVAQPMMVNRNELQFFEVLFREKDEGELKEKEPLTQRKRLDLRSN